MDRDEELAIIRRAYARQVLAEVGLDDPRLEAAFAAVRREEFLGPGPWVMPRWFDGFVATPADDPVLLYVDKIVQIDGERHVNNGQPSGHAKWLAAAGIREGDRVVHVGAGTGYYTAIMAHLAGPSGRVTGIEVDRALAERARRNLATLAHVDVVAGDGFAACPGPADVVYVNAGATRPAEAWLDALAGGGRLIVPLTTDRGFPNRDPTLPVGRTGAMFRIERTGGGYAARWLSPVAIIPCEGGRDPVSEAALAAAFAAGGWDRVTRLHRGDDPPEGCWLTAPGWALACD